MIKAILRNICPPVVYRALVSARSALTSGAPKKLFDGDDELFKELVVKSGTYGEYGCGASTIWVANNANCNILGVDSSQAWLDKVRQETGNAAKLRLHFADVGNVGSWGRPVNYDRCENFDDYTDWIWGQDLSPDLVLVDGRFRVCCFLTSLLHAKEGTQILFDDYNNREHYHFVERFVKPSRTCGRQALFPVPNKGEIDSDHLRKAIDRFRFVLE